MTTTTSVRIPVSLALEMKKRGLSPSQLLTTALRAALQEDDESPEEVVAQMIRERDARIEVVVQKAVEFEGSDREKALAAFQTAYNEYLASEGFKPLEARLMWVKARKTAFPGLDALDARAILKEVEG